MICCLIAVHVAQAGIISEITCEGNKRTKPHIIARELTFQVGDTLPFENYEKDCIQSKNNILNTSLFNFCTVEFCDSLEFTKVKIKVTERWYIWPEIILKFQERNFTEWLKNRNLSRIDYGLYVSHLNFRGRQEKLQIQLKNGFNQKIGLLYQIPYLTKSMKAGLSIGVSYNTQNEVFTGIDSLNKMLYTKNSDDVLMENISVHAEYTRRNDLYSRHFLMADYRDLRLKNELRELNNEFLIGENKLRFITLTYLFKNDRRDSKNYPLNGSYADVEIKQNGIGIDQSNLNISSISTNYRSYHFMASRLYFAFGAYAKAFSSPNVPFYLQDGLGFNHYVRSYEPYIINGQLSTVGKAQLKFQVLKPKVHKIPFIKTEKFSKIHYAIFSNLFVDAGYVHNNFNKQRRLDNEFLLGVGIGLDFVTFYDLVWRYEYSINKYLEHGLYISFVAPI